MASKTYKARGLVLRRVKLGETDVICIIMSTDGSLIKAVAKGARKPQSSFASRLEIFSVCDLFIAQGRSLDIIKEARLVEANRVLRDDIDRQFAANPILELLDKSIHADLEVPRLFEMTTTALQAMGTCPKSALNSLTAAYLFKALAFQGFKPSFDRCVGCGDEVQPSGDLLSFSVYDGGVVCANCKGSHETRQVSSQTIAWAQAALFSSFEQISAFPITDETLRDLLQMAQQLILAHLNIRLKSLRMLVA